MFNDKHWLQKNWDQNGPTVQRNYIKDLVFPYGNHVKQTWIHLLIAVGRLPSQAFIFHFLHRWNSRVMIYNPISAKKHEHFYSKIFFTWSCGTHSTNMLTDFNAPMQNFSNGFLSIFPFKFDLIDKSRKRWNKASSFTARFRLLFVVAVCR